jgi:hypothetical protein
VARDQRGRHDGRAHPPRRALHRLARRPERARAAPGVLAEGAGCGALERAIRRGTAGGGRRGRRGADLRSSSGRRTSGRRRDGSSFP